MDSAPLSVPCKKSTYDLGSGHGGCMVTRTTTVGTLAAIGGLTATIALLTGLPAATADELADLRANQELLQRRIDQLAQQAQLPPTKAYPGPGGAYGTEPIPGQALIGGSFP